VQDKYCRIFLLTSSLEPYNRQKIRAFILIWTNLCLDMSQKNDEKNQTTSLNTSF
jgi:hypothetical protein